MGKFLCNGVLTVDILAMTCTLQDLVEENIAVAQVINASGLNPGSKGTFTYKPASSELAAASIAHVTACLVSILATHSSRVVTWQCPDHGLLLPKLVL